MSDNHSARVASDESTVRHRFHIGIRTALEEMLTGRDYARVEDILRALAHETGDASTAPQQSKRP